MQEVYYVAKTKLTKEIDDTRKAFDNVVYGYGITVHKSQGSTFKQVFVDVNNIYQSKHQYANILGY